jgi:hypothetical protein
MKDLENKKREKKQRRRKKYKRASGNPSAQIRKEAHGPNLLRPETVPPPLSPPHLQVGQRCQALLPPPAVTPALTPPARIPPLFNSHKYLAVSISICAYKSPQMTSVDPLSSSCSRHRRIDGINRRTPQSLRASLVKSANDGEPRAPSSLLTFLPRPGAPP